MQRVSSKSWQLSQLCGHYPNMYSDVPLPGELTPYTFVFYIDRGERHWIIQPSIMNVSPIRWFLTATITMTNT
jgi:hypothetical protein